MGDVRVKIFIIIIIFIFFVEREKAFTECLLKCNFFFIKKIPYIVSFCSTNQTIVNLLNMSSVLYFGLGLGTNVSNFMNALCVIFHVLPD